MPSASCCSAFSVSSIRTWRMIWLSSSCGCDWNFTPIQPWHSLPPLIAAGHHGVGEGEERVVVAPLLVEPLQVELVLVVEHRLQAPPADVALGLAVDRVADRHVVRRHRLGDRAGRAAGPEEPARHLLPGADLRERAVPPGIEVDLQRLLQSADGNVHRSLLQPSIVEPAARIVSPERFGEVHIEALVRFAGQRRSSGRPRRVSRDRDRQNRAPIPSAPGICAPRQRSWRHRDHG